jgi:hypothetical protein
VTFNNCGRDVDPLSQVEGETYTLTLPLNPLGSERPVFPFSDWMPIAPLARRGFGSLPLVRSYSDQFLRISSGGLPDHAIGRLHAGFCADGNLTTSPWTAPQTNAVNAFAVHGVQYISPALGATVVGIGDSIMASSCTTGQSSGFGIRACAIVSTPQLPVSYFNEGYPGRNSSGFCSCGTWVIQHLKPQAALIQTWSGNEPWTLGDGRSVRRSGDGGRRYGAPQPLRADPRDPCSGVRDQPRSRGAQATQPHSGSCRGASRWLSVGPRHALGYRSNAQHLSARI